MDIFGCALKDRSEGNRKDLYFEVGGQLFRHELKRYFRKSDKLSKGEKKIISLCHGNILDIGCGTGNYIPELRKKGKVDAIDSSHDVISVANILGNLECHEADIFEYMTSESYDTITLFENNIGLGGSPEKTTELLRIMKGLLADHGQIIGTLSKRVGKNDFVVSELIPIYDGMKGDTIEWINLNPEYLANLCNQVGGMTLDIISSNRYYTIYKIIKA